jgi:hypothetical protein
MILILCGLKRFDLASVALGVHTNETDDTGSAVLAACLTTRIGKNFDAFASEPIESSEYPICGRSFNEDKPGRNCIQPLHFAELVNR